MGTSLRNMNSASKSNETSQASPLPPNRNQQTRSKKFLSGFFRQQVRSRSSQPEPDNSSKLPSSSTEPKKSQAPATATATLPPENEAPNSKLPKSEDTPNVWALALADFEKADPELCAEFSVLEHAQELSSKNATHTQSQDDIILSKSTPADEALLNIQALQEEKTLLHKKSARFRELFEGTVKLILSAKGAVSAIAEANPYAAAAWTAVSFILPMVLASTEQNEAALEGLHFISVVIVEYRWREKCYLTSDSASDFIEGLRKLYASVLDYEATLYVHMNKPALKRLARNVLKQGDWASRLEELKKLDSFCRKLTDAIAETRAFEWSKTEKTWQQEMLDQPRRQAEKNNLKKLYTGYESAKNIHPIPTTGTLEWFLKHPDFLAWRASRSSALLWVTGDPGCGKSVLSKCLVDRKAELVRTTADNLVVCYYFFRGDYIELSSATAAIKACLHQLIAQRPNLYQHAARDFEDKGDKFLDDFEILWKIFTDVIHDSSNQEVICILDGLDECHGPGTQPKLLLSKLAELAESFHALDETPAIKILISSRPYTKIERELREATSLAPNGRVRGEEKNKEMEVEIGLVRDERTAALAKKLDLDPRTREILYQSISKIPNQTHLWLRLTFDYLESQEEMGSQNISDLLERIPNSADDAFNKLLQECQSPSRARRLLSLVLGAFVPLSPQELNILMNINSDCTMSSTIALWPAASMEDRIKNICGLFVRIIDNKVYLIHAKAREFLLAPAKDSVSRDDPKGADSKWKQSFHKDRSSSVLTEACVQFLSLVDFHDRNISANSWRMKNTPALTIFPYASRYWPYHSIAAGDTLAADVNRQIATKLYDTGQNIFHLWTKEFHEHTTARYLPIGGTGLMYAAYLGQTVIIKELLGKAQSASDVDENGRTAIFFAVYRGHAEATKALQENGADLNVKDNIWQTPFLLALQRGHLEIAEFLEEAGADPSTIDAFGCNALVYGGDKAKVLVHGLKEPGHKNDATTGLSKLLNGIKNFTFGWAAPGTVEDEDEMTLERMVSHLEGYMRTQCRCERWETSGRDSLVYDQTMPRTTGLGALYNTIYAGIEAYSAGPERYEDARELITTAFSSLKSVRGGDPPSFLIYIPRTIALMWTQGPYGLAFAFLERICESKYCKLDGVTQPLYWICKELQQLLEQEDAPAATILHEFIQAQIAIWKVFLPDGHIQIPYTEHVLWIIRGWFEPPEQLTEELRALSMETDETEGRSSIKAIQVLRDLAQNLLQREDVPAAREAGKEIAARVLGSVPAPTDSMTPRMEEIYDEPRMIHFLLEGLRVIREAHLLERDLDAVETNFQMAVELSDLYGRHHVRTVELRAAFGRWLTAQGREDEAEAYAAERVRL